MSLTKFIQQPEINKRLSELVNNADLGKVSFPDAPAPSGRNDLVGIAYDYFLRFYLQRYCRKYFEKQLVAEKVLHILGPTEIMTFDKNGSVDYTENENTIYAKKLYKEISELRKSYCSEGRFEASFALSILKLSQLDLIYRSGNFVGKFYDIREEEIDDLTHLIHLTNPDIFNIKNHVICNPTFGDASSKVGGADCDLIIDDTLIEIKTVKSTKKWKEYLRQLIGYFLLFEIGGIDGVNTNINVKNLSLYFSRHVRLVKFSVQDIFKTKENKENYIEWFKEKIENR